MDGYLRGDAGTTGGETPGGFPLRETEIGAIDFFKELDLIKRIRDVYTKEQVELRVDANGGFCRRMR